jgi:hypothetical protein
VNGSISTALGATGDAPVQDAKGNSNPTESASVDMMVRFLKIDPVAYLVRRQNTSTVGDFISVARLIPARAGCIHQLREMRHQRIAER